MSSSDWSVLTTSLSTGVVRRGVTSGVTPPPGGGSFVYGFNSVSAGVTGAVGLYHNAVNFSPMAAGGRVVGAMRRLPSGGTDGFAPMLFIGLQSSDVAASGYLLGTQNDDPSRIVLRKGPLNGGLPEGIVGESGILRISVDEVAVDEWAHLRLDMIANTNGDVILQCFRNDLTENDVDDPVWEAIPGMADFTDDALGINSGSVPLTSGRAGFAFWCSDITRRAVFDSIQIARQL